MVSFIRDWARRVGQGSERIDFMLFTLLNNSLLSRIKISGPHPIFSECAMGSLFRSINTYISKSNKLEKHLGMMPGENSCQHFFHFVNVVSKLLIATIDESYLKSIFLFEL